MKNLVVGNRGQIGSAIQKILGCEGIDIREHNRFNTFDVLHICIPYSEEFIKIVEAYIAEYKPQFTIIHSTLPVGTCEKINGEIVYSPCRGKHPDLEKGIRTFVKYFAGEKAREASDIFYNRGMIVHPRVDLKSLEAAKLWDTTQYGWNILLEKQIYAYCEKHNLDFELVYTMFNQSYNEGYEKLGMPQYKKYVLKHMEGKIGGHCVVNNLNLLEDITADFIKKSGLA